MTHSCPTLRSSDLGEARLLSRGAGPHRPAHRFGQTCGTEKPRLHRWCGRLCGDMQAASRAPLNGDDENPEPTSVERAPDDSPDGSREGSTVDSTGDSGEQNVDLARTPPIRRSEEPTSALQSLMRIPYAVFCLKKQTIQHTHRTSH